MRFDIELDPYGGIVVHWPRARLWLLVDGPPPTPDLPREAWLVWRGKPLGRTPLALA